MIHNATDTMKAVLFMFEKHKNMASEKNIPLTKGKADSVCRNKVLDSEKQEFLKLHNEGLFIDDIAAKTSRSTTSIRKYLISVGIFNRKRTNQKSK